ncbi:MAG TPA: alcohol dehydrogenase catalytic domain-containing protein [Candidatus Yaniella excrementigallinarum]|nr:alcohol dehydrogenase catalytic domain-containing protein [Candidatus Yaniella excrementigallinarum]
MLRAHTVARHQIELKEEPEPVLQPGHALVRVHHVALCGTDFAIWDDNYLTELPLVQGHEFTGVIEAIDSKASDLTVGTPVAISPMVYCGTCGPCRAGRYNVCETISCLGCYQDGALAELICLPVEKLHPIPINMPLRLGALGEPGSIAMQAVKRGTPVDGETALVLGCGPIGLLATLFLTDHGVNVVAADLDEHRMMLARKFGAVATISAGVDPFPSPEDTKVLAEACQMAGPTLVIEATGVPVSLANAVRLAAPTARVVQVGISDTTAALSLRDIPFKELDIRGSRNSLNLIPEALEMLAKHQDLAAELITHDFEFAQLPKAFETMGDRNAQVGKIVIDLPAANAPDSTAQLQEVHPA